MKRHTLDPTCPCEECARGAFEAKAVALVLAGLLAIAALVWLAVRL